MEPLVPHKKLESGIFQGTPELLLSKKVAPPRLIRTMKGDALDAIKNQNETTVSIAIAEEKKNAVARAGAYATGAMDENTSPAPKPIGRIVIIIVVLLIITLLGFAYVFLLPKLGAIKLPDISIPSFSSFSKNVSVPVATTTEKTTTLASSLIPAGYEKHFNITNQTQKQIGVEINAEIKQGLPSGSIKNLYFTEGKTEAATVSASGLFMFADISAPEILTRSLEKEFMAGLFGEESWGVTPFLILKVSSYETGLAGMLEWETMLPSSIDTLFGTKIASGPSSKTKFRDIVVFGKDARSIDTALGGTIAYAFATPNTIVIAGSTVALETLLPLAGKN